MSDAEDDKETLEDCIARSAELLRMKYGYFDEDEFEGLRKELAALRAAQIPPARFPAAVSPWVRTSERMPPPGVRVLVALVDSARLEICALRGGPDEPQQDCGGLHGWWNHPDGALAPGEVSHWMPLPEPPEVT
jgi:hypothetical protein